MKNLLTLSGFIFLGILSANAQKVTGNIKNPEGATLEKSTVSLLSAKDSSIKKLGLTGANGRYEIETVAGSYLVSASFVGYDKAYSAIFELKEGATVELPTLVIAKSSSKLDNVVVTAQKPMVEVRADKTILNVEGTINATGNDALELLRKAPGVTVDKDDNLSLAGKNGVQIFIDGKPSPLAGSDLANFLKSMQSAQVESIEIITNPSAKYEAAGNAGIINIKLKKNKSFGTNGSVNLGYNQGFYPKFNGGINLNHRNKKINLYGSYNYNNGKFRNQMNMVKNQFDTLFDQKNVMLFTNNTHGFKGGIDYFMSDKSTIGAVVTGNIAENEISTSGPMYFIHVPTNKVDRILRATSNDDRNRDNMNFNLNYRYANKDKELNLDGDYGFFKNRSVQLQPNIYFMPDDKTEINRTVYEMISPSDIDLLSLKADYEQGFAGGRLGLGAKVGVVETDNDFQRYNVFSQGKVLDTLKSNLFNYKENINALYVNYNRQFKGGFMLQAGLRAENTNAKGVSTGHNLENGKYEVYDSTFKRNYTDLFPSAALTYNKNPKSQFTVSYSRRIDRPAYQDLNPFEFRLSEYTFMKGNTLLRPQYTNSIGLTHIFQYKLTTSLNYSHVKDIFAQVPDTIEKTKSFMIKRNLANQDVVSLNISYPFQYKTLSIYANLNTNYSHYKADFGGGNRTVDQKVFALTYYMQNSLKIGKTWTAELSALYISPSIWGGMFRSTAMGSIDLGMQKTLFKGAGTMRVAVSDVFKTMRWQGTADFAGVKSKAFGNGEMQVVKISFNYRFGNMQVKAARLRKTGIDDEKKRAEGGGGSGMGGQ